MGRPPKLGLPAAAPTANTISKKDRLSLGELAAYDDLLTDVLVDHVYSWFTIRKNKSKYAQLRRINDDEVCHILLHDLIVGQNMPMVESRLLKLPALERYYNGLGSIREKQDFTRHMQTYINIWRADCPFDVSTTNRYTIRTHEAATTARRFIKTGETIKYLVGNLVAMTKAEEQDLGLTRRDFSVVLSSRKKIPSLFLGPARFANHDCKANARLQTNGSEGMTIVAARNIEVDEEITVNYGQDYFGEDNCNCLCASCESEVRGGWVPKAEREKRDAELKSKSKDSSTSSPSSSPAKRVRSHEEPTTAKAVNGTGSSKKPKLSEGLDTAATGLKTPPDSTQKSSPVSERDPQIASDEAVSTAISKTHSQTLPTRLSNPKSHSKLNTKTIEASQFYGTKLPCQPSSKSQLNTRPSGPVRDPTTQSTLDWIGNIGSKQKQNPHSSLWNAPTYGEHIPCSSSFFEGRVDLHRLVDREVRTNKSVGGACIARSPSRSSSALSSVPPEIDEDEDYFLPRESIRGRPRKPFRSLAESTKRRYGHSPHIHASPARPLGARHPLATVSSETDVEEPDNEFEVQLDRVPGDYIRTRALLTQRNSRWVDCRTCENTWVNHDPKQTRRECPRCERHSKLYGFQWPKTENKGEEKEMRIMDHRFVNRFLAPNEEKMEQRRGRGLQANNQEIDKSSEAVSEDIDEGSRTRELRRTSARAGKKRGYEENIDGPGKVIKSGKGWAMILT